MTQTAEYATLMRDMPTEERPRERLRLRGPETLTNAELIAILLRTGTMGENVLTVANRILSRFDGLRGLGQVGFQELAGEHAMGEAKACQLLAAVELGVRIANAPKDATRVIRLPADVYAMLYGEMGLADQEELKVILLNVRNEVLRVRDVYKGNVSSVVVRTAEVFKDAVREGCPSIVLVHNHPSGDATPSAEDVVLTRHIVAAGKMLGIEVLDHVVIARNGFVSMKDGKIGFE